MTRSVPQSTARHTLPRGCRIGCCSSSYHADITGAMRASALETLLGAGLESERFVDASVPGAFELPLVAQRMARRKDVDCVLCFGLVLKGETEHDRHIAGAVAHGLMQVGLATEKPVLFGVLTCSTLDQAWARARREAEGGLDKGREVALAAIEVLAALDELKR